MSYYEVTSLANDQWILAMNNGFQIDELKEMEETIKASSRFGIISENELVRLKLIYPFMKWDNKHNIFRVSANNPYCFGAISTIIIFIIFYFEVIV